MEYTLVAKASIQIQKPVTKVFEAVVNPEIMSNYFISKGSERMVSNAEIIWSFPEFEGNFTIKTGEVVLNKKVVFYWGAPGDEKVVKIEFIAYNNETVVNITEGSAPLSDKNLEWVIGNTEGWSSFLLCLKAWLEYGIHLRQGAYKYRFDENFNK